MGVTILIYFSFHLRPLFMKTFSHIAYRDTWVVWQILHNVFRGNDVQIFPTFHNADRGKVSANDPNFHSVYHGKASANDPNFHNVYHGKVSAIWSTFRTFRSAYHDKAFQARRLCLHNEFQFQDRIGLSFR